jgi:hypothetical protein
MDQQPSEFDEVRKEAPQAEKSALSEDKPHNNRTVTGFLWHGDRFATPLQRAGLTVFALLFLLMAALSVDTYLEKPADDRSWMSLVVPFGLSAIAARLLWNVFKRTPKHD